MAETAAQPAAGHLAGIPAPARFPLPVTAAVLIAIAALFSTAPQAIVLPQLAVLILGTYITRVRLPRQALVVWTLRFVLFSLIIFTSKLENRGLYRWYIKPDYSNLIGILLAIEIAIEYWLPGPVRRGPVLAFAGIVFTFATNTFEPAYIRVLAPAFVLSAMAAFRDFRPRWRGIGPAGARRTAWVLRGMFVLTAMALGLSVVIAFQQFGRLVERITLAPPWSKQNIVRVGMSGSPMLGASFNSRPSPLRVMRVAGLVGEAHLRGLCFEDYSDNRWSPSFDGRTFEPVSRLDLGGGARGKRYTITRWIDRMHLMYAPLNSAGLGLIGGSNAVWDKPARIVRDINTVPGEYVYEAIMAATPEFQGPLCGPLSPADRRRCLAIAPEIDRRVLQLARQITAGIDDPAGKAAALERYLQKNYAYSLEVKGAAGDRISDFILNRRPAHCQYFASALVMMLRAVGIPARFVAGYYAHEPEGRDAVVVRQRDAHAWTEAWIDGGRGWITLDATPSTGRPDQAYPPVGFFRKAGEWLSDLWTALADFVGGLTVTKVLLALATVTGGIIAILWMRLLIRRRRRPLSRGDDYAYPNADLKSLAAAFENVLSARGLPCAAHRTWRQHVAAVAADAARRPAGLDCDLMQHFVREYDLARFGPDEDAAAVARLREMLAAMQPPRRLTRKD